MKRIVIYVSDHGFGHASRVIGLVRQLQQRNCEIIIKNSNAYDFLKSHLPNNKIIKLKTDVGPISDIFSNNPDYEKTFSLYDNWINDQQKWLNKEIKFYKNKKIDLIISDISPISIKLANILHIPSVTIANFTWIDILEKFPHNKNKNKILNWLKDSSEMTDLCIKTPLHMKLNGMKRTKKCSLLCRNITKSNKDILKKLKLNHKPITVYFGNNSLPKINITTNKLKTNIIYLLQNNIKINNKIIKNREESQNIISASNLVISKPGYSIISECINSLCPIFLIPRKNYPEDKVLYEQSKKLGIAQILDLEKENNSIKITEFNFKELRNNIKVEQIKKIQELPKASSLINEFLYK